MIQTTRTLSRCLLLCLAIDTAHAHFTLVQPPSAWATDSGGKGDPPCGEGIPSNIVTSVQGGRPITIRLREFIFHPGHYRIALSVNSRAELPPDPAVQDDNGISSSASIQNPIRIPLLADGLFAHTAPPSADLVTSITLPNLNCERCTLQISEFMAEHGAPYFYHHCADLRITADPTLPPADPAWPRAAIQSAAVVPYVIAGGGWSTALTLVNTSATPIDAAVEFHAEDGAPWTLSTPAAKTIGPNATLTVPAPEQPPFTIKGWALVRSAAPLSGFATYRSPASTEATASLSPAADAGTPINLLYDNTAGSETHIAIANRAAVAATLTAALWDDLGVSLTTTTITVTAGGYLEWILPTQLPATAGTRGILRLSPTTVPIAASAFRISPSGALITLPPL